MTAVSAPRPVRVEPGTRLGVPWPTVLLLAAVLTYADGFFTTALHTAVGDVSRIQEPFTSYWRTATLALPLFVLAVLAATTVALRRFGPELRTRGPLVATVVLTAAAGTLAAVVVGVLSSAYDYRLQDARLGTMHGMQDDCDADCLFRQQWMTIGAHVRAVALTGGAVLVADVVLVALVVALLGGRLRVSTGPTPARTPWWAGGTTGRASDLRLLAGTALVGVGAVHAAVVAEHLEEWWAAGTFFVVLAAAEVVVAVGLVRGGRTWARAAVGVSVVPLVVWTVSRTVGLPFGPEAGEPEAVGLADVVACVLELVTLVAALVLLRTRRGAVAPPLPAHLRALVLTAVVALAALGLAAAVPTWIDGAEPATDEPGHHAAHDGG